MNFLAPLTLFGWIPAVLVMFMLLPPRRAIIAAFVGGWLFLPMGGYQFSGLPDYSKGTAISLGVLLGVILFDLDRLLRYRFHWLDSFVGVWCLSPFATSLSNGLGAYDGMGVVARQVLDYAIPYLIGRVYFTDWQGVRELAIGLLAGGLLYAPLCLWEIRMSPQLHRIVYGYSFLSWNLVGRFGGYRPVVFLQTGLATGLFMATASVVGVWLWRSGALKRLGPVPIPYLVLPLVVTTVLCKSVGAIVLMGVGLVALWMGQRWQSMVLVILLAAVPVFYLAARTVGDWSGEEVVALAGQFSEERAGSLRVRFENEQVLSEHALKRPLLGWGAWGRNRVKDEYTGEDIVITDSLWILALGWYGLIGLTAMFGATLVPAAVFYRRYHARMWTDASLAAPAALAMVLLMFTWDNLLNAMANPLYILTAGSLNGFLVAPAVAAMRSGRRGRRYPASADGADARSAAGSPERGRLEPSVVVLPPQLHGRAGFATDGTRKPATKTL